MVDPKVRKEHPLSDLEWSRFAQVQITSYKVQASGPTADGDLAQVAQIGVVSKLSQAERVVTAQELWHWDDEAKRWWLVSGFRSEEHTSELQSLMHISYSVFCFKKNKNQ